MNSKRRILVFLAFFTVISASFGLTAYGFLRSSYVQKRVIASIRQPLTELGIELKFDDFEVDVFAGFNFVNLRLKIDNPPTIKADISVEKARLRYGFWALIRQKLELTNATLHGLQGSINLKLPPAKELQSKKEFSLNHLIQMIKKPNFTLSIPSVDVSRIQLHVALTQGENFTEFDIEKTEASAQIQLQPEMLKARLTATVVASGRQTLSNQGPDSGSPLGKTSLVFDRVEAHPHFNVEVSTPADQLNVMLDLNKFYLELNNFNLASTTNNLSMQSSFSARKLTLNSRLSLSRTGALDTQQGWLELLKSIKTAGDAEFFASNLTHTQKTLQQNISKSNALYLNQIKVSQNWDVALAESISDSAHSWSLKLKTHLNGLRIIPETSLQTSVESASVASTSNVKEGAGELKSVVSLNGVENKLLAKPISLEQVAQIQLNIKNGSLDGELSAKLNHLKIFDAQINALDSDSKLKASLNFNAKTSSQLSDVLPNLNGLANLGWPEIRGSGSLELEHRKPLLDFDQKSWHDVSASAESSFTATPTLKLDVNRMVSYSSAHASLKAHLAKRDPGEKTNKFNSELTYQLIDLNAPSMSSPTTISGKVAVNADLGQESTGAIQNTTSADSQPLITMTSRWTDKPKSFTAEHDMQIDGLSKIIEKIRDPGFIATIGNLGVKSQSSINMKHPADSIISLSDSHLKKTALTATLNQSIIQKAKISGSSPILLKNPIKALTDIKMNEGRIELSSHVDGDSLAYGKLAELNGIKGTISGSVNDIKQPTTAFFKAHFGVKSIDFMKLASGLNDFERQLRDINFNVQAALNGNKIIVNAIEGGLKDGTIRFFGQGEFKTSGSGQLDGELTSSLLEENTLISGSGSFKAPVKLILFDKQRLSVEAKPSFTKFNVKIGEFSARNVNGELSVLEELSIDKTGKIGFLYLKTQNPFARVDYENVEPYVEQKSKLTFDHVSWNHITVGPVLQSLEVRQNLVLLNELKMDLLDGSMVGRFYLDLHPSRLKTGFLGRFSGLKPELLKAPDKRAPAQDWSAFAGRMAVDFDMRKRLASGRMDFTQIGKKQLLSLLDVVDPEFKDNQVGLARKGLRIAYPKKVGVSMDHGLMDVAIDLGGALNQTVGIRSLPLSGLINAHAGEVLNGLETMIN